MIGIVLAGCGAQRLPPVRSEPAPQSEETPAPQGAREIASSAQVALGLPGDSDPADDYLMDKGVFVLSYSDARHQPNWVAWRVTKEDLGDVGRSGSFHADSELPVEFLKIGPKDYERSGYDRGHMCPSAHRTSSRAANALTFVMTNMQPQTHSLNAGPWKALEAYERSNASEGKVVLVVAGGIFAAKSPRIGPGIAVPDANFRVTVVLEQGQVASDVSASTETLAAILPNDASVQGHSWEEFKVTIDEVERRSGYDVLANLPDRIENEIEARH